MGTNIFGKESENLNISATINITLLDVLEGKDITHSYKKQQPPCFIRNYYNNNKPGATSFPLARRCKTTTTSNHRNIAIQI